MFVERFDVNFEEVEMTLDVSVLLLIDMMVDCVELLKLKSWT